MFNTAHSVSILAGKLKPIAYTTRFLAEYLAFTPHWTTPTLYNLTYTPLPPSDTALGAGYSFIGPSSATTVPVGTLLYGEKGHYTRVSLWDSLVFGRLAVGFANARAGARVLMLVLVQARTVCSSAGRPERSPWWSGRPRAAARPT